MPTPKKKAVSSIQDIAPHSIDGEKGVLSSMLQSKDVLTDCMSKVDVEDFWIPAHKTVFEEMRKSWKKGKSHDLITLTQALEDQHLLLETGGAGAITELYTFVPSPVNYLYYIEICKDKAVCRKTLEICLAGVEKIKSEPDQIHDSLLGLQADIGLLKPWSPEPERTLSDDMDDKLVRMSEGEPNEDVIPTGLERLDYYSPLRRGDFPVITGIRKGGKSILALTILENVCIKRKCTGLYFSLEDRRAKVADRIFAGLSRIPTDRHHSKLMNADEVERAEKAIEQVKDSNLIVKDDHFDLTRIIATSRHIAATYKDLELIVVDYGQLVRAEAKKGASREQEVAMVSRDLRLLGMELNVAIILLSQLNEAGATRESKALEQDCTARWDISFEEDADGMSEYKISIPFQRNGVSRVEFPVTFIGNIARVENAEVETRE